MALTSSQLEQYRRILTARRDELAAATVRAENQVNDQEDLSRSDVGDRANANVAREDLLQEAGRDSEQLGQIEAALARMRTGIYGVCTQCGEEIGKARLDAVPWAELCIRDQENSDRTLYATGVTPADVTTGGAPSRVTL